MTHSPNEPGNLSTPLRLLAFGLLYFVQGAALAYFRNFQKPYLNSVGISADDIALLTTILLLPFIFKIFIGMLSDRVNLFGLGHRKPYIVGGLLLAMATFTGVAFVPPDTRFMLFSVFIVTGSFSVALFDSTTDGLAIDTTPAGQQGTVQGTMVGGRAVGFIILSLIFGWLVGASGYRVVFLIIAGAMVIPLVLVLNIHEPEALTRDRFEWGAFRAVARGRFLVFAVYAVFYSVVSFGIDGLVTFFMSEGFNAPETMIGTYGSLRGGGAVIGALAAGFLLDRIGRKPIAFAALTVVSVVGVLIGLAGGIPVLLVLGVVWGIAWGFQETVFVALAMYLSDTRIAASMFAIMMAISNLGTAVGEGAATGLSDNWGFPAVFIALAAFNIINLPILLGLFRVAPELNSTNHPL